jgi:hypothetical protein
MRMPGGIRRHSGQPGAVHLAAKTAQSSGLTAAVNPVARPRRRVSHGLYFAVEIVERMKLVGDRLSPTGVGSYEQQVGDKPAIR